MNKAKKSQQSEIEYLRKWVDRENKRSARATADANFYFIVRHSGLSDTELQHEVVRLRRSAEARLRRFENRGT